MNRRAFYWDFFGPRGKPTAEHFERHVRQFLEQHACPADTAIESAGPGHTAVRCLVPLDWAERVERALKPKRSSDVD